jgi:hypothetical protein
MNATTPAPTSTVTPFNLSMVLIGAIILFYGLNRITPIKINKQFYLLNVPIAIMGILGYWFLIAHPHGNLIYKQWGKAAAGYGVSFMPLMILLVLVMSLGTVIIGIHAEAIRVIFMKNPLTATVLAMFLSPTSNSLIPIVQNVWQVPGMQPYMLLYLQGSVLASIPLFMLRLVGFGENSGIPAKMYITGLIVAVIMIVLVKPIFWVTEAVCALGASIGKV